jgi:hypothetical protein
MTYTVGGLIEAADYNGFANTSGNNVNAIWSVGTGDKGYGQTAIATVSTGGVVTATQWATLVTNLSALGSHQGTTITSRTAPVAGNVIAILSNVATDINNLTGARGNAVASGSEIVTFSGTTSKTTATGSGSTPWTITFSHTVTFPSADQARYFWNAGGIVRLRVSKTSTGELADAEWNDLAGVLMNEIRLVGRVNSADQVIGGVTYTGVNKTVGSGTPDIHLTTTGWYTLTTSDTIIYKHFADTAPYTGQFIQVEAKTAGSGTQLVLTTTWTDPGGSGAGSSDVISGGTETTSPFSTFGTAPTTLITLFPPNSTHIADTWGTPTIAASVTES